MNSNCILCIEKKERKYFNPFFNYIIHFSVKQTSFNEKLLPNKLTDINSSFQFLYSLILILCHSSTKSDLVSTFDPEYLLIFDDQCYE